jgi:hypothetical protein
MKLKAHFTKLKTQSKIENEDFNKFIDAIPEEMEIPDIAVNLLDENFLTRTRAGADKEVYNKVRAEVLNGVDKQIKDILPLLTTADREAIEKETNTFEKVALLKGGFEAAIKTVKDSNPDASEQLKEAKKFSADLMEKLKTVNSEKENQEKALKTQFEQEKKGMKLGWTLDKKFADYEIGEEFKPIRDTVFTGIIEKIKKDHVLELDDKGDIQVLDSNTKQPKYNGNDQVTIDSLLAEPLKPFLKKNNAGDDKRDKNQQRQQAPNTQTPPKAMTLREMNAAAVRQNQ